MAERVTFAWDQKRRARATPVPLVVLRLPFGPKFYSFRHVGTDVISYGEQFDGAADFDASVTYDGGGVASDRAGRLLAIDPIREAAIANAGEFLASLSQAERASLSVELDNADGAMSTLVGREYLLNQTLEAYISFQGIMISQAVKRFSGKIASYTLSKRSLRILAEADA